MYRSDSVLFLIRLGRSLSEVAVSDGHHDDKRNQVWVGAILNITLVVLADFVLAVLDALRSLPKHDHSRVHDS